MAVSDSRPLTSIGASGRRRVVVSPVEAIAAHFEECRVTRAPVVLAHAPHNAPDAAATLEGLGARPGAPSAVSAVRIRLTDTTDPTELARLLASRFDTELAPRDRLGPVLCSMSSSALVQRVTGRDSRLRLFENVRRFLGALATARRTSLSLPDCRVVVVFEQAHRATSDVLELLQFLADDALESPAIAGASTVQARAGMLIQFATDSSVGQSLLRRYESRAGVVAWQDFPDAEPDFLARADVVSTLKRITESREFGTDALVALLPPSIDELYALRLGSLPHEAHRLLRALDRAGRPVPAAALEGVASVTRFTIERVRREGFLATTEAGCTLASWANVPPVALDANETAEVDAAVARHLERVHAATGDVTALVRACELWGSAGVGVSVSAAQLTQLASELAIRGATAEAVRVLTQALSSVTVDQHSGIHLALADLEVDRGNIAEGLAQLKLAAREDAALNPGQLSTSQLNSTVLVRLARLEAVSGASDRALALIERVRLRGDLSHIEALALTVEEAEVQLRRGQLDQAEHLARSALADIPTDELRFELEHTLGKVAFWRGQWAEAEAAYSRLLKQVPTRFGRLRALVAHNLGLVGLRTGRHAEAARQLEAALLDFEAHGDHFEAAVCLHNLGLAHEHGQRYALAMMAFERSIDLFERFGTAQNLVGAVTSLADLYIGVGESWRARRLLQHALDRANGAGLAYCAAFATLRLAAVHVLDDEPEEARSVAARALVDFQRLGHKDEESEAYLLLGQLGDLEALRQAQHLGGPETRARAELALGVIESRTTRSVVLLTKALGQLEGLGQLSGIAQAHGALAVAHHRLGQSQDAKDHDTKAKAAVGSLEARVPEDSREAFGRMVWVRTLRSFEATPTVPSNVGLAGGGPVGSGALAASSHGIIGASSAMKRVFDVVERVARANAPALIVGESGTGKELIAEALWRASDRSGKPLIRVNAAAFAETLLESELFGHEKGAFTGATSRKLGAFEQANGGTLFLDEIGDISAKTQVSLLRVLQNGDVRRVGGSEPVKVDVRIICATNRDLNAMVQRGTFRLDLYYRIRGVEVGLPPLRDRGADLDLLADHLLARLATEHGQRPVELAPEARSLLRRHDWPGNVRELENVIRSAFFFARLGRITADDLLSYTTLRESLHSLEPTAFDDIAEDVNPDEDVALPGGFDLNEAKRQLEVRCIERALDQSAGNISKAAQLLGLKRPRLSQKIKEYGLKEPG